MSDNSNTPEATDHNNDDDDNTTTNDAMDTSEASKDQPQEKRTENGDTNSNKSGKPKADVMNLLYCSLCQEICRYKCDTNYGPVS